VQVVGAAPGVGRRVAQNIIALLGGRIASTIMQFLAFGVIAQYLGPGNLGVYSFAVALATLFRVVPNFGFAPVVARDIAQDPERERELIPNVVYMRFVLGLGAYAILIGFVYAAGYSGANREAALIAGTLLFLLPIDAMASVLQVRLKQGWVALSESIKSFVFLAGVIVLAQMEAPVTHFVWLYVATNVINALIVVIVALRWTKMTWTVRTQLWRAVIASAAPLALANLFIQLYARVDLVILAAVKPAEDVGQYGAAYKFLEAALLLPSLFVGTLLPVFAASFKAGTDVFNRRYGRSVHLITVVALPVAIGGAMTAWRVLPELPGFGSYEGGGVALSILCPAAGLAFVAFVVQGALISGHLQRRVLVISAIGAVFNVLLNLALIFEFSYVGAAIATSATELVVLIWSVHAARTRLDLRWPVERLWKTLLATLAMVLVLAPAYALPAIPQVILGALAYVAAVWVTGAISPLDLEGVLRRGVKPAPAEPVVAEPEPL
jgi:O-antigen/teichoic acid export membrane protein